MTAILAFLKNLFAPSLGTAIDDFGTWAANEASELIAKTPTIVQAPLAAIAQILIVAGVDAADTLVGITPEHAVAIVTHAVMTHPDVAAANPATLKSAGASPALKAA